MATTVLYSRHGSRYNVRADYDHLPWQPFWTWITGKGRVLGDAERAQAMQPLSTLLTLWHIAWSWCLIGLAVWGADHVLSNYSLWPGVLAVAICWVVVIYRARCLQATFHYMTHGSAMPARGWAEVAATIAFTTPFFYEGWRAYGRSHVTDHHHLRVLCSSQDPDQRFIESCGFRVGMSESSFWWRVWLLPATPRFVLAQCRQALKATCLQPHWPERLARIGLLSLAAAGAIAIDGWERALLLFGVPAWWLFRHSLWLQLITEHLWFAPRGNDAGTAEAYGRLTWGRFQGRPLPEGGALSWLRWWAALLFCDLPVRLYVYPQDLPNHDFHHRRPLVPYHVIADLRRTCENEVGRLGPACEVWGFLATLRVQRDHLCRGVFDPFRPTYFNQPSTPATP